VRRRLLADCGGALVRRPSFGTDRVSGRWLLDWCCFIGRPGPLHGVPNLKHLLLDLGGVFVGAPARFNFLEHQPVAPSREDPVHEVLAYLVDLGKGAIIELWVACLRIG